MMNSTQLFPIFALLLLLLTSTTGAQRTPPAGSEQYGYASFSPSIAIVIVVLIAALFFMGFFSIYIRNRNDSISGGRATASAGILARSRRANRGLDREAIEMFPTFAYSEVKDRKIGKGALECAVCLNEFEDDETLRLLPKCDHVFHPDCIDAWLASHTTCPVCRSDLADETPIAGETPIVDELRANEIEAAISIRVEDDPVEQAAPDGGLKPSRSMNQNRPPRSGSVKSYLLSKLPRSHTTGHSLVNPGENVERFTLRLPEEVRKEIMSRALNRTTSLLILPRETSSRRGYRTDDGRAKLYRRLESLDRVQKSDPWVFSMAPPFFVKSSSLRSSKMTSSNNNIGEGTSSSSSSMVPRGGFINSLKKSFGRLNSKNSEPSLASGDSARLTV